MHTEFGRTASDRPATARGLTPLLMAGIALAGAASAVSVPSGSPQGGLASHLVRLTSVLDEVSADYQGVFATAEANVQQLSSEAQTASSALNQALSSTFSGYDTAISHALSGAELGLQNSIDGGWYGRDDGYVFGLFGGSVTHDGVTEQGSTLNEIFTALEHGNLFGAYSYFDTWSLETMDHTLKALVNPVLSVASHGVTTPSVVGEELQTLTNVYNELFSYTNLKELGDALLSPEIGALFGFTGDLDNIATALSTGNFELVGVDVLKMPADVLNDLLNGYTEVNPHDGSDTPFTGLLNNGSLLDDLLVTWPHELTMALEPVDVATALAGTEGVESLLGLL